ncbi:DNA-binding GntR family transcriptional regulator [Arthrobacter sp. JUb119]|nr:DNA-binding GntR family transcriptional regulator [Arthrobacter sp. JUb119]
MLKKFAASSAALTLASVMLTGCSAGKMSTEETCVYINDQVAERELQKKAEDSSAALLAGDTSAYAEIMNEFDSILGEAAENTKDNKLATSLNAASEQTKKMAGLMAEGNSSNMMEISQKIAELDTTEASEATEYLNTACPDMDSFS